MKVSFSCSQCIVHAYVFGEIEDILTAESEELVENEPIIVKKCGAGHTVNAIILPPKFDILFQYGCEALIDGYHREAVTGFAVSLERFVEFFIRFAVYKANTPPELFELAWKMTKQTERQTGAFVFLYLLHFSRPLPEAFRKEFESRSKYRNDCVHAGLIPTRAAAIDHGTWVYETIKSFLREIEVMDRGSIRRFIDRELEILKAKHKGTNFVLATADSAIAAYATDDVPWEPFGDQLERIQVSKAN